MSITITWSVKTLERTTANGAVNTVHYTVNGTDGTYTGGAYGSVNLTGDVTIPYADLTEETCIGWVKNALGQEMPAEDAEGNPISDADRTAAAVSQIETAITNQINEQAAPTRATGTPWS
tara:strand:+ start:5660 stop:6019 length:360 start_codon:yes stop_codon:yes gene_type:complete